MRFTPEYIDRLEKDEIFVFGSNYAGRHGKGAAREALKYGATKGIGRGLSGQTYAFPTKDARIQTLPLQYIKDEVRYFMECVDKNKDKIFLLTKVGCGLAGYTPEEIGMLFKGYIIPENLIMPKEFYEVLNT